MVWSLEGQRENVMKWGQRSRQGKSRYVETVGHGKEFGFYFKAMGSHGKVASGGVYDLFKNF